MTPEEAWPHVKLDVSSFKVFGSVTWAFVPNSQRREMEWKSQPLIFFCYCKDVKTYRLFYPNFREVLF